MKPGQQMQYDPEEIRKWKKLIYGTHMVSTQVDEWVSNGQDNRKSNRRKTGTKPKYGGSMPTFGSSNTGSNNDSFSNSSYGQDEWLHASPGAAKRTYKYK